MSDLTQKKTSEAARSRYVAMSRWRRLHRGTATNVTLLFALLLAVMALASLLLPVQINFYTAGNLSVLAQQLPIIAITAIGVGILMIAGEFDLSVTGVFTLAPYLMALALNRWGWPLAPALALAIAAGVVAGLINGAVTLRLAVPSFIATLGTMFMLRGFVRFVSISPTTDQPDQISLNPGAAFHDLVAGQIAGPLYMQTIWFLVIAILAFLLLNRHTLGNHIFAVGGDRDAAEKTGIRAAPVKVAAFVVCSTLAAIAGIIQATRINMIDPAQTLTGLELQAIASAVIGGVYLFGGRGSILGMALGAALLVCIENILELLRFPGEYMPAFVGSMVIISVITNSNFGPARAGRRGSL
jgi:simple sugar transport system permease protein